MEPNEMKKNERLSEEQLRLEVMKKIESLPTEKTRELYQDIIAPMELYIDDHGLVCFDEKGMKWAMEEDGWTARLDGHAIFCTNNITAPTVVQRQEAYDRAVALSTPEDPDLTTLKETVRQEDAPSTNHSADSGADFLGRPGRMRDTEWSPRRELHEFARLCTPQQLEQLTQDVLNIPYCSKVGNAFMLVRAHADGQTLDEKTGEKRMNRIALQRELSHALDKVSMDDFAKLCSEALGKSCTHLGNGRFAVDQPYQQPTIDMSPGLGRSR